MDRLAADLRGGNAIASRIIDSQRSEMWQAKDSDDRLQVIKQTTVLTDHQVRNIRRRLLRWGQKNYHEYPWRKEKDAWLTFVAEVFLQRTQARQVEGVYDQFKRLYPTPLTLLHANPNEISDLVRKLGLEFRIGWLREIAAFVVERGGSLPEEMVELTKLKGIGTYTAAAWLSLHRGNRAVLIDSNVVRWLSRMTGNAYNRDPRGVVWVSDLAERLTPPKAFRKYNYAVLDFTMKICSPRKPNCINCPNCVDCLHGSKLIAMKDHPDLRE